MFHSKFGITGSIVDKGVVPIIRKERNASYSCPIDFYDPMKSDGKYLFDSVHPDSIGDYIMVQIAFGAIQPCLTNSRLNR